MHFHPTQVLAVPTSKTHSIFFFRYRFVKFHTFKAEQNKTLAPLRHFCGRYDMCSIPSWYYVARIENRFTAILCCDATLAVAMLCLGGSAGYEPGLNTACSRGYCSE